MNKVKWFAFYQWMAGLLEEGLGRVNRRGFLRGPFKEEMEAAAGRKIRILLAPLGTNVSSRLLAFRLRRLIKHAFGRAVEIVPTSEPMNWAEALSFEAFAAQYARAQQLLVDNHCEVLVVPRAGAADLSLHLVSAEAKRQATYLQIEKNQLPIFVGRGAYRLLAGRLVVAVALGAHIPEETRVPLLRKAIARLRPVGALPRQLLSNALLNEAFLHRQLGEIESSENLEKAAQTYHQVLKELSREREPLEWAAVQDNLGGVLRLLGEREQDISVLHQAINAFGEALNERTLERAPMLWVGSQGNLGAALANLGALKQPARLEEALSVLQAALAECPREQAPLDWAKLQHDLGRVLLRLSSQSKDMVHLAQAINAFRFALEERRHEDVRTQWAITQQSLGNALLFFGERSKGTAELHEAVTAFRAALQERNRHVNAKQWANIQQSLGTAMTAIGTREADRAYLQQAVACYREALKVRIRNQVSLEWATTQHSLGMALLRLADLESDPARLTEAIVAFENALLERTREAAPLQCAATQTNLGLAQARLAEFQSGTTDLEKAVGAYRTAVEIYEDAGNQHAVRSVSAHLALAERRLKGAAAS
jgi:tetratricopeptide (TPR) repeat protein